jgi:hypothetical protein
MPRKSKKLTPNTLPIVTRADGTIDVAENSWGITTVEAEYDRAMRAAGDFERAHPVEAAVSSLEHCWKHNRHTSSGCDYGWTLEYYSKLAIWEKVKPLVEAKGLPVTKEAWNVVERNFIWKLRAKMVAEGRGLEHLKKQPWFASYEALKRVDHPVLRGEWKGDEI